MKTEPAKIGRPKTTDTRKIVGLPADLAAAVEDYRFKHRFKTEAEAIRRLIEAGLQQGAPQAEPEKLSPGGKVSGGQTLYDLLVQFYREDPAHLVDFGYDGDPPTTPEEAAGRDARQVAPYDVRNMLEVLSEPDGDYRESETAQRIVALLRLIATGIPPEPPKPRRRSKKATGA